MRFCQMKYGKLPCLFFSFLILMLHFGIPEAHAAAPVISQIDSQTTKEDTAVTVAFTINANTSPFPFPFETPSQDTSVTVTANSDNRVLIPTANIVHSSSGTDHSVTITPAANQYGQATIILTADDGSYSSMRSFVLTVTSVNDAPAVTVPEAQTVEEDGEFIFGSTAAKTISVSDVDAGSNAVETTVSVSHGTLTAGSASGSGITGNQTSAVKLTGTIEQISNWLNGLIYAPDADWNGTDTLTVTINDKGHSGENTGSVFPFPFLGNSLSDSKTLALTVTPVNDSLSLGIPQTVQVTDEDTDLLFRADTGNAVSVTDADGIAGEFEVEMEAENGSMSVPEDTELTVESEGEGHLRLRGTLSRINTALAGLTYEPGSDWHGEETLSFTARDLVNSETKTGEIAIQVNSVNDAPVLDNSAEIILASVVMNDDTPPENRVADITENAAADADEEEDEPGMAVVSADNAIGTWEYSVNNGADWTAFGADLSAGSAMLLSADDLIRFVPLPDQTGKAFITFRAWDGSDGKSAGSTADTSENGGAAAFSQKIATASVTISEIPGPGLSVQANAGADQEVTEGNTVTLNGAESVIPDDAEISVEWTQENNGISVTLSDIHSLTPSFTAPEVGTEGIELIFTLILRDTAGNAWTDSTAVKVKDSSPASLKAKAGADQEVAEGAVVTLDGSASSIPAGVSPLYNWEKTSGPDVALSSPNAASTTFVAPNVASGTQTVLVFRLTVSDSSGNSDADTITVKVSKSVANQLPVANAGANQNVKKGDTVTLSGAASYDPDGTVAAWQWKELSNGAVILTTPDSVSTTFTAPSGGSTGKTLTFELTVTDNAGQQAKDTVTVSVAADNGNLPVANAGANQNVKKGDTVTLNGSGSYDPDGSIVTWQWKELSTAAVALSTPANVSTTFTAPSGGTAGKTLTFELTVTDNAGQQAKDTVTVYVGADSVIPGPGQGEESVPVTEGGTITLKGSEAGDFPSDASYSWVQLSGPAVELSNANIADPSFVTPAVGAGGADLAFQLTVTSGGSQVYRGTVTVKVLDNGIVITGAPEGVLTFKPVTTVQMGISIGNSGKLIRLDAVDPASITDSRNRPESMIYGLIHMEIRTAKAGDTVPVTLYLNNAVSDGYKWYKYSENNGWSDFSANTVISADRKQITLTLTDGGAGDSDGLVNGIITDPSGLGKPSSGTSQSSSGAGDDGGCFVRSACSGLPNVLSDAWIHFLSGLSGNTSGQK
ncbi:MAG: choice-of-anchor U domain-containing protein [Desulfobacterales bacterium]